MLVFHMILKIILKIGSDSEKKITFTACLMMSDIDISCV